VRDGDRSAKMNVGEKSDPVTGQQKVIQEMSIEDDQRLRHLARKTAVNDLEILKACNVVVERMDFMMKELQYNAKVKETIIWSEEFERKYCIWKTTNLRFLNLKESNQKEMAKENTLLDFCAIKGLLKQKESWETSLETILEKKENRVKEIYRKLKLYKTKKKKLELLKECKETLILTIKNPTMTLENLESEVYANLKEEKAKAERNLAATVVEKMTPRVSEDDLGAKPMNIDVNVTQPGIVTTTKKEPMKPTFRSSKVTTNWKTTPSKTDKKMTPVKKKMTAKIKNSPVAMNVANRLGLKNLPNVKMMAERLQRTHLPPTQNEAKYKFCKVTIPIIISSSFGEQKPGCTPVNWASQPMGGKLGQRTGVHAADGPIGAGEEPE
jgi:hypothetical protein